MSMENNASQEASVDLSDNLDAFEAEFFGQTSTEGAATPEADAHSDDDAPQNTDTQEEADTLDSETGDDDGDEGEVDDEPTNEAPKKKNRFQERIDEVVGKQREAERRAEEYERRLNEALQRLEQTPAPKPNETAESGEPTPFDTNEDGTEKYPLGEFDPNYLKDLTKYAIASEREAVKQEALREAEQAKLEAERQTLQVEWENKLDPARERYPDFQEKGEALVSSFSGLDPTYGEYLTAQIMDLENGPDVLYYLANNPDEAHKIVSAGARKATVALGRLDAKFSFAEEEKQKARPKVSQAPTPPPTNRGATAARIEIAPDTDDLDAFEKSFFKPRR